MELTNKQSKSILAKLLATENVTVEHGNYQTASFDVKNRVLRLPIWKEMSGSLYDLLVLHEVGHALFTPEEGMHDAKGHGKGFKSFLNVVEDARIERKIKVKYPGGRRSFIEGYSNLMERDFFGIRNIIPPATNVITYDISLNNIYTTWGPPDDSNLTNIRIMFSPNGPNNEWDQSITAWSYPLTSTKHITNTLSLPANKINTTYKYSRAYDDNPQFRVEGKYDNNINRNNRINPLDPFDASGRNFPTTDISFNGEPLWWDKTYSFTPAITALHNPGDGEYPTNYQSGTTPYYGDIYDNSNTIDNSARIGTMECLD